MMTSLGKVLSLMQGIDNVDCADESRGSRWGE